MKEVECLRAPLPNPRLQAAEPVERKHGPLLPVTAAELDAVLARLREVKPLA